MTNTKSRLLALLLTLVMAVSLVTPALAVEEGQTLQAVICQLLSETGLSQEQLGSVEDCLSLAESLGMIDGSEDLTAPCSQEQLAQLTDIAQQVSAAVEAGTPLFLNGMAQPIFPYTSGSVETGYSNDNSDIIRYCVYVQTDYDTDDDGQLDLVKALVQVPRSAVEGNYQAATIYEARPYITGCTEIWGDYSFYGDEGYDISKLYSQPDASTLTTTPLTTLQAAAKAQSSDWYYWNPYEEIYDYEDLDWYDYYLVRGFAVVESAGLGTTGSDGFETCGTDLEIAAFKNIIEWLHGDANRVAYTDKTRTETVTADWSNGKVGMTGRSYAGTTQFGLATTGVEGLETIVPVAGIASWYEYTNSQGVSNGSDGVNYSDILGLYCAGRYLDEEDWATISEKYGNYLGQLVEDQEALNGDYGDHWAVRDYTLDAENIKCPALIVHGLNDDNVRTKEFDLMYQAYQTAGVTAKLLLHQDAHLTPTYPYQGIEFTINGETYDSILNKWFSHYLYDVDNGIENMAAVTAQSNYDADLWNTYDSWETAQSVLFTDSSATGTTTISSDYTKIGVDTSEEWWGYSFDLGSLATQSTSVSSYYAMDVTESMVIKGSVAVSFKASVANEDSAMASDTDLPLNQRDGLMVSAMLVDIAPEGETMKAFNTEGSYVPKTTLAEDGVWQGGGLSPLDLVTLKASDVSYKIVARGWMDLCNPTAGYSSSSASVDTKVTLEEGQYHDYTIYLQPNLYTVPEGHTLALVVYTYEPPLASYDQNYTITLDNASVSASIPVDESAPAQVFTDVSASDWFYDAVSYVADKGMMNGVSTSRFSPSTTTTRAMLVTILYRLEGEPAVSGASGFADVAANSYYADAVAWAAENGVVNGTSSTKFSPTTPVTREQAAAILYRYAALKGYDVESTADLSAYTDAGTISSYAVDAMTWANQTGLITGVNKTTLKPKGNATRAQMATILMRLCENIVK